MEQFRMDFTLTERGLADGRSSPGAGAEPKPPRAVVPHSSPFRLPDASKRLLQSKRKHRSNRPIVL